MYFILYIFNFYIYTYMCVSQWVVVFPMHTIKYAFDVNMPNCK